ncbi:MAG: hypothetical protein P4L57_05980 [Rhizomicrobium sp.]|nr:hypothetical protein [Rhizomicrobium sp.]
MGKTYNRDFSLQWTSQAEVVRIHLRGVGLSLGCIAIDRCRDRAVFTNLSLLHPFWRSVQPLSMIVGAQIVKRERGNRQAAYGVALHLFKGPSIRFACRSRAVAQATLAALHKHLPVEMRSSGRAQPGFAVQDNQNGASLAPHGAALRC